MTNLNHALLDFIGARVEDDAEYQSFSNATGYASTTRQAYRETPRNYSHWESRLSVYLNSGEVLAWATERGFQQFVVPTTVAELRVGDVIRLEGGRWSDHRRNGDTTIVERESRTEVGVDQHNVVDDRSWPFVFVSRPGVSDGETPTEVTLEEALASGSYHPDMLPLFEKFSKVADDAGHCAEYDRLARAAGAPTRAEVRTLVAARDGARFKVRIPVKVYIDVEVNATNTDEARDLASRQANSGTWTGLATGVRDVASNVLDNGLYGGSHMSYEGIGSFEVTAL